jgi:hypothetical protein
MYSDTVHYFKFACTHRTARRVPPELVARATARTRGTAVAAVTAHVGVVSRLLLQLQLTPLQHPRHRLTLADTELNNTNRARVQVK